MRFYDISITDQSGTPIIIDGVPMRFTSFKNGVSTPGALNIEFDIPVVTEDIPAGNAFLKIWGIPLAILNKARSLNYANITIMAGMKFGLPLANAQAAAIPIRNGVIYQGSIFQAFGNWQGAEQTLDLIITTQLSATPQDAASKTKPFVFSCKAGATFADAIKQTMASAKINAVVAIDPSVVAAEPIIFTADTITTFAQTLNDQSIRVKKLPAYPGIKVAKTITGYSFTDNSSPGGGINVDFTDLIGQPAWQDFATVQMKTVLRSDIHVTDTVNLPQANVLNSAKAFSNLKESIAYKGTAWVKSVRHIGNFRQPDANSWVTVIDALPNING